ncbi:MULTISPECIES: hypothetical protein [unclassified Rubrivivax]|uniref:hypothetical protein n=1 Tax=unclassified Rubrivivax TaxID=2649762 RepID=UPI001E2B745D|nr:MULTISPECIES: hypothetical protein [unclassified Rubrivivax]MCC9598386.1 hypothetical protein [Rubrivivax sp. JA1055]MCC9648086.1 hypothetical protein [Rubrivivax sp. JA1029]
MNSGKAHAARRPRGNGPGDQRERAQARLDDPSRPLANAMSLLNAAARLSAHAAVAARGPRP